MKPLSPMKSKKRNTVDKLLEMENNSINQPEKIDLPLSQEKNRIKDAIALANKKKKVTVDESMLIIDEETLD